MSFKPIGSSMESKLSNMSLSEERSRNQNSSNQVATNFSNRRSQQAVGANTLLENARRTLYSQVVIRGVSPQRSRQTNTTSRPSSRQSEISNVTNISSEQSDFTDDTYISRFRRTDGSVRSRTPSSSSSSYIVFGSAHNSPPRRSFAQVVNSSPRRSFAQAVNSPPRRSYAQAVDSKNLRPRSPLFRAWGQDSESESELSTISERDSGINFSHLTIVSFGAYTRSNGVLIDYYNAQERFNAIKAHFQIPGPEVRYDAGLSIHGLVGPNQSPRIGPAAFADRVQYPSLGPVTELDPEIVELHVALTIAHEQTHLRQYEQFPTINLGGFDNRLNKMPPNISTRIQQSHLDQTRIFEYFAYNSEVRNIDQFLENNPSLSQDKLNQVHALRDIAIYMRDDFIDQLTSSARTPFMWGDIEQALNETRRGVPIDMILPPTRLSP